MTPSGDTDRPFSKDDIERSLVARLAEMVERHGERVALRDGQRTVTYRDLGRRVAAVASSIVSRETRGPVAVLLDHGADAVIAFLGVIAAGCAYVPLDPTYPREHLRKMLAHSEASLAVTSESHLGLCAELAPAVAVLDFAAVAVDGSPGGLAFWASRSTADSHACILYTSGSTGAPKGTVHSHRTLQHLIWSHVTSYGLGPDDRLALVFSTSFAASLSEIFGAVLTGASLSLTSAKRTGNLAAWIRREGITVLKLPVSLFRVFLRSLEADADFPDTRLVLLGGDALFRKDVETFRAHFPKRCLLVNRLTSTESLSITRYPIAHDLPLDADVVPVGYPDHDTCVLILDDAGHPVPAGELGQIVVRSRYLSPGYWRDDELTRATFAPHDDGSVTLRTGDLGRLRPDGCLEHFGRGDQQVKVRGHRVEMAAVEAALNAVDGVKEAAVVVQTTEGEGEGKRLVGYVVLRGADQVSVSALRAALARSLPDYMIPSVFVPLERLPTTATGKIDRRALPAPGSVRPLVDGAFVPARTAAEQQLTAIWTSVLKLDSVGVSDNFFDLGGDSLMLLRVHACLREVTGREVPIVDLFAHPTIAALAAHLAQGTPAREPSGARQSSHGASHHIAIIGMAGIFPGARDLTEYWANLRAGVESIRSLSDDELLAAGVSPEELTAPDYVRTVPELPELRCFDADFWGLPPSEAAILDPQHRLLLETAWHALEDAGRAPEKSPGRIGVFVGAPQSAYLQQHLLSQRDRLAASELQLRLACDPEFLATRIAYKLDLTGPALNVATACSTALVAVHLACRSLQNGECEVALAGGAAVENTELCGYRYREGWITSRDGHCRPFDASAQGTVFGSGAGIVVLKPLERALADGDRISAVIRGSAINNDGSHKVGFAAPSMEGQVAVLAAAQAAAGLAGDAIDYVETHGTGTALGDPIEIAALTRAFGDVRPGSIAIGSVKANVGHLSRAAGIAGLIKTVLALEHGELPPGLNFERPNPQIDFARSPFFVNTELRPWPRLPGRPRRAAVSSFGVGGTNAHVILEEAPPASASDASKPWQLLPLSAKSEPALAASSIALLEAISHGTSELADIAWTLQTGRADHAFRHSLVCRDRDDARTKLAAFSGAVPHRHDGSAPAVVFMFPGQGAQYPGMAAGLYADEPSFRADVDFCAEHLARELDFDLRAILYARDGGDALLRQTRITQPALFVTEWATARLLMRFGIRPDAMIGHSVGEHTAACLAGVLSVEATLALIARRGRLIQSLPTGCMLVVHLPESEASALCNDAISLAAVNAPRLCVLAGPEPAIAELIQRLMAREIDHHLLHTSHAFHSWMMDPALADFTAELSRHPTSPPSIPYLSGVTGTWLTPGQATAPDYWSRLLRGTVRFSDGLRTLASLSNAVLVEVGPGASLSALARLHPELASFATVPSLRTAREARSDREVLLEGLGKLWQHGAPVDWNAVRSTEKRRRVPLPGYPFQRTLHWVPRPRPQAPLAPRPPIPIADAPPAVAAPAVAPQAPSLRQRVQSAAAHERVPLLCDYLARTINTLLGHAPEHALDPTQTLVDLGIDSLACIRLGEQLARDLGVGVAVRAILAATIDSLAASLGAQMVRAPAR
jgi:amino acid adenylation domain-containing protein